MNAKIYNKLIRQSGKQAIIEEVSGEEYLEFLNAKLSEELQEYLESQSVEELADLVEVVYAILEHKSVSLEEFEHIRKQKVEERGAFKDKLLLKKLSTVEGLNQIDSKDQAEGKPWQCSRRSLCRVVL